jgi:mono/diheme cytochrome c family protein
MIAALWGAATGVAGADPAPAAPLTGAALFQAKCALCHLPGQTGTRMLERRLGKERSLLTDRSDLQAAYVKATVRGGLNSMPAITRVEVSDAQLDLIAEYVCYKEGKLTS